MAGNISKTGTELVDNKKLFIKKVNVDKFDTRTLAFQSNLRQYIKGKFNINQYEKIEVKSENNELIYKVYFDMLDEKDWKPTPENMEIIGKSMAYIHNHSNRNMSMINLPSKQETYDSMENWLSLSDNIPFKKESYEKRKTIFREIKPLNQAQPKIPLHRDFKPHNIIFNGESYNLIDFDFAAIDFISLEVMGFLVDIIDTGLNNVQSFLKSYFGHIDKNIKIVPESFVDDYLSYLCTNTFPFYLHESLESNNFQQLVEHRNKSLETLYTKRLIIKELIKDIIHENI